MFIIPPNCSKCILTPPIRWPISLYHYTCRNSKFKLTQKQLEQLSISSIYKFTPRVKKNIVLSLFSPQLTGSIKYTGKISLGVKAGFKVTDKIKGVYTCKLAGLPLKKSFTYPSGIGGLPVIQDIALDAEVVINFSSDINFNGSAEFVANATLGTSLFYNNATGVWETDTSYSSGYDTDFKLSYGARYSARAAIIPTVSTTLYKTATASLSADSGANLRVAVELIGLNDPVKDFRTEPFILEDFTADADIKFLLEADYTILGKTLLKYPKRQIYKTKPLRIFDTHLVCTNNAGKRKDCRPEKKLSKSANKNTYNLQIYVRDGKNNQVDLSSIQWKVSPKNGYIKVDPADPRKAVLTTFDDRAYTVVSSANGVLSNAGRQYAKFSLTGRCTYGLGHQVPEKYDQYFYGNMGYQLPKGMNIIDTKNDFPEVCQVDGAQKNTVFTYSYYGGQLNGISTGMTVNGGIIKDRYKNGILISSTATDKEFTTQTRFRVFTIPSDDFIYTVPIYIRTTPRKPPQLGDESKYAEEQIVDPDKLTFTAVSYYPDGTKATENITRVELKLDADPLRGSFPTASYGDIQGESLISYMAWYPNGQLNYSTSPGYIKYCGWERYSESNDFIPIDYNARQPGDRYKCDVGKPV